MLLMASVWQGRLHISQISRELFKKIPNFGSLHWMILTWKEFGRAGPRDGSSQQIQCRTRRTRRPPHLEDAAAWCMDPANRVSYHDPKNTSTPQGKANNCSASRAEFGVEILPSGDDVAAQRADNHH